MQGTYVQAQNIPRVGFINKVFAFFAGALLIATIGAFLGFSSTSMTMVLANPFILFGSVILQLILAFTVHLWQDKKPLNFIIFGFFALLSGFLLTPILLYAVGVMGAQAGMMLIYKALLGATITFAAAGIFGWVTNRDLTSLGGFLMVALIGIIITSVVNIFLGSNVLELVASGAGILIFTGFVAYDIQMIKRHYGDNMYVLAAMQLFLNFINLFTSILRFLIAMNRN